MTESKTRLAEAIHASADLMASRSVAAEVLDQASALVEQANQLLATGEVRTEEDRLREFASQMIVPMGAPVIEEGARFEAFTASPYSGKHNPMRPTSVSYRRVGDEIHADVMVGPALEGAPGRAHGGLTAAIFDDVMGAMQRIIGLSGYTRSLEVTYLGKIPIDETVKFCAQLTDQDEHTFTIEAQAIFDDKDVATARGVFTSMVLPDFIPLDIPLDGDQ